MVIDSSALLAILFGEADAHGMAQAIERDALPMMSAASLLEASMALYSRYGVQGIYDLDILIAKARIQIMPFDEDQSLQARRAFTKYGKGRHPVGLNFGDCMAYALAKETGELLLFKGKDFAQTDIVSALPE